MNSVVMYHYVQRAPRVKGCEIERFETQLRFLKSQVPILNLAQFLQRDPGVLLTFDDGYREHAYEVLDRLREFRLPAVFFIPRPAIQATRLLDVHQVHYLMTCVPSDEHFAHAVNEALSQGGYTHPYRPDEIHARYDRGAIAWAKRLLQRELSREVRREVLAAVWQKLSPESETEVAARWYVGMRGVERLGEAGMEFGGHGIEHEWWDIAPIESQRQEIDDSGAWLREIGMPSDRWTFAYPYGSYRSETVSYLKAVGFRAAFGTVPGSVTAQADEFRLPRWDTNDINGAKSPWWPAPNFRS